jgi:hypothetical protein
MIDSVCILFNLIDSINYNLGPSQFLCNKIFNLSIKYEYFGNLRNARLNIN